MNRLTLEEKQEILNKVDEMKKQGISAEKASVKLGLKSKTDIYRFRQQLTKANGQGLREIKHVNNGSEKMLRVENQRLRTLLVDLMLDVQALKEYHGR